MCFRVSSAAFVLSHCAGAPGAVEASGEPDWASLPQDLWRRVVHSAALGGLAAGEQPGLGAFTWRCKLLATVSSVCSSLRSAVLGPDSGLLWETAVLSCTHPGLTRQHSKGVNMFVADQGSFAVNLALYGGGWKAQELQEALDCVTDLSGMLDLININSPAEAAIISRSLAPQPLKEVYYNGSAACILPKTTTGLSLRASLTDQVWVGASGKFGQGVFQRFLGCLRPLSMLQQLDLHMLCWRLTSADVEDFRARHPHLRSLHLMLLAEARVGRQAVECLQQLSNVELTLRLVYLTRSPAFAQLLQQLQGLHLAGLEIECREELSSAEERLLARCSMEKLTMRFTARTLRLRQPPPGVRVVYSYAR